MNNSSLTDDTFDLPVDNTVRYREKESDLVKIIEAINRLAVNPDWNFLQEKIFDGVVEGLKKERDNEVEKQPLNGPKIHSINGQLKWAKKYSNVVDLAQIYKLELTNVRKQLNG
jgi:hypothetical protein